MYLSHNLFDPVPVIKEIQHRMDLPEIEFHDIYRYLLRWADEWYEGLVPEEDVLLDLLFVDLPIDNVDSITVLPVCWRTIKVETEEDHSESISFPLIMMEYFP